MCISSSFTSVAILSATAVALLSACSPNPSNATANANYNKVNAGPEAADHAALDAKLRNAEAALRRAQSVYDAAYREDPAGIGGHPAGLELEQATNNFNAAKAEYDRIFKPASAADKSAALRQIADARAQSSVTVVRVNNLRIEINVDEVDVTKVKLSQEAMIVAPEGSQP